MTHNCTKIMQDNIYEKGEWMSMVIVYHNDFTVYLYILLATEANWSLANGVFKFG